MPVVVRWSRSLLLLWWYEAEVLLLLVTCLALVISLRLTGLVRIFAGCTGTLHARVVRIGYLECALRVHTSYTMR